MTQTSKPRSSAQLCQTRSAVWAGLDKLRAGAGQTRSARLRPERSRKKDAAKASIEAAEVAHRDAEGIELGIHVLGGHTQARDLLEDFGVVHRADRRVVGRGSSSYDVGAGLVVDEGQ